MKMSKQSYLCRRQKRRRGDPQLLPNMSLARVENDLGTLGTEGSAGGEASEEQQSRITV